MSSRSRNIRAANPRGANGTLTKPVTRQKPFPHKRILLWHLLKQLNCRHTTAVPTSCPPTQDPGPWAGSGPRHAGIPRNPPFRHDVICESQRSLRSWRSSLGQNKDKSRTFVSRSLSDRGFIPCHQNFLFSCALLTSIRHKLIVLEILSVS